MTYLNAFNFTELEGAYWFVHVRQSVCLSSSRPLHLLAAGELKKRLRYNHDVWPMFLILNVNSALEEALQDLFSCVACT